MKAYLTEYDLGGAVYASHVFANDKGEAEKIITSRNISEKIIGEMDFVDCIDREKLPKLIHTICFLSYIALKSGKATAEEILSDKGVLHEAIHLLDGSFNEDTIKTFNEKLNWLYAITNSTPPIAMPLSIINTGLA